jgi:hypothetical protein
MARVLERRWRPLLDRAGLSLQMLMHQGRFNGAQLLRPQTVALMGQNQIGDISAGLWKTTRSSQTTWTCSREFRANGVSGT